MRGPYVADSILAASSLDKPSLNAQPKRVRTYLLIP